MAGDFKHATPICPHCGAAYTPHTPECPKYGYPPPALAPKGPVSIETRPRMVLMSTPQAGDANAPRRRARDLQNDYDAGRVVVGVDWTQPRFAGHPLPGQFVSVFARGGRSYLHDVWRRALAAKYDRELLEKWALLLGVDFQGGMLQRDAADAAERERIDREIRLMQAFPPKGKDEP